MSPASAWMAGRITSMTSRTLSISTTDLLACRARRMVADPQLREQQQRPGRRCSPGLRAAHAGFAPAPRVWEPDRVSEHELRANHEHSAVLAAKRRSLIGVPKVRQ